MVTLIVQISKKFIYVVRCGDKDCNKRSFHLSVYEIALENGLSGYSFYFPSDRKRPVLEIKGYQEKKFKDILDTNGEPIIELDDLFFYSDPSSFFTIDERVPASIRKPLSES